MRKVYRTLVRKCEMKRLLRDLVIDWKMMS